MQLAIIICTIELSLFAISSCGENKQRPAEQQMAPAQQQTPSPAAQDSKSVPKSDGGVAVDVFPEVIKQVQPKYPEEALKKGIQGNVLLQVHVSAKGIPEEIKITKNETGSAELGESAVNAVKQWKFKPALKKDKPVPVWVVIPVRFKLK